MHRPDQDFPTPTPKVPNPVPSPGRNPSFRLLWAGEALASFSEQLFIVCLTLLVLDIAGPGSMLGLVLAAAAVPRAVLLLGGGLLADRLDPARVVVITTWLRTAVLGLLAALVVLGPPPLITIAVLAAVLGVLDAAYYPASLVLLPQVVAPAGLVRANALVQGAESAGDLFGPGLAAGLIAAFGVGGGLSTVACLYASAAVVLTALLRRVSTNRHTPRTVPTHDSRPVNVTAVHTSAPETDRGWRALREGLRFAWAAPVVRTMLIVLAVLNVAVIGPILVGGAVLSEQRLGGAEALGTIFIGFGAGSLLGLVAAGARPPTRRGLVLVATTAVIGAGTVAFGFVDDRLSAIAVAATIGVGEAYLGVVMVAWLQELVPEQLRGRVMSLVVLSVIAFDPLSYALAGALLPAGVTALFAVSGGLVLLCAAAMAITPKVRSLT